VETAARARYATRRDPRYSAAAGKIFHDRHLSIEIRVSF
jgi:hypothetical protein